MIKLNELLSNPLVPLSVLSQQNQPLSIRASTKDKLEGFIKKYNRKSNFTSGKEGLHYLVDFHEMFSRFYKFDDDDDAQTKMRVAYLKMKRFLELEKDITSRELFFALFGELYPCNEMSCIFLDEMEVALERSKRNQGNYATTSRWANYQEIEYAKFQIKKGNKNHHMPDIGKYVKFLNSVPNDEPVIMYRGFLCRKELGKQIRESNDKKDAGYWSQIEGRGTSYSLKREIAETFAIRRTDMTSILKILNGMCELVKFGKGEKLSSVRSYHKKSETKEGYKEIIDEVSRVLGWKLVKEGEKEGHYFLDIKNTTPISEIVDNIMNAGYSWALDMAKELLEEEWNYSSSLPEELGDGKETYEGYGVRPIVGTYSVFKDDILIIHDKFGEAELTVLPKNAHLERYDFMTTDDIIQASRSIIEGLKITE